MVGVSKKSSTTTQGAKGSSKAKAKGGNSKSGTSKGGHSKASGRRTPALTESQTAETYAQDYISTSASRVARAAARENLLSGGASTARVPELLALSSKSSKKGTTAAVTQAEGNSVLNQVVDVRLRQYETFLHEQKEFYQHFLVRGVVGELEKMNVVLKQCECRIQSSFLPMGGTTSFPLERLTKAQIRTGLLCLAEAQVIHQKQQEKIWGRHGDTSNEVLDLGLSSDDLAVLQAASRCFDQVIPMNHATNFRSTTDIRHRTRVVGLLRQGMEYLTLWQGLGLHRGVTSSNKEEGVSKTKLRLGAFPHLRHAARPPTETYAQKLDGVKSQLGYIQAHPFLLHPGSRGGAVGIDVATADRIRAAQIWRPTSNDMPLTVQEGVMVVRRNKERLRYMEALLQRANRTGYPPHLRLARNAGVAARTSGGGSADTSSASQAIEGGIVGLDPVVSELPPEGFSSRPEYHSRLDQELRELSTSLGVVTIVPVGRDPSLLLRLTSGQAASGSSSQKEEDDAPAATDVPSVSDVVEELRKRQGATADAMEHPWCSQFGLVVVTLKSDVASTAAAEHVFDQAGPLIGFVAAVVRFE